MSISFFDRYQYNIRTDKIGEGAFGKVYKAYDKIRDRYVAIKIAEVVIINGKEVSLQNEINAVQNIPIHQNIAFYEGVEKIDQPNGVFEYAVMQYYELGSLRDMISSSFSQITLDQKKGLLIGIVTGLNHLHKHNIIHRDLKPSNILVVRRNDELIPKITDFGLSKVLTNNDLSFGTNSMVGGTLDYSAPEQLSTGTINKATDYWAFGAIVYEVWTGKKIFQHGLKERSGQLLQALVIDNIMNTNLPADINSLPIHIRQIVLACIRKNLNDRPRNLDSVTQLLQSDDSSISGSDIALSSIGTQEELLDKTIIFDNNEQANEARDILKKYKSQELEAKRREEAARIEAENLQKAEEAKLIAAEKARLEQEAKYKLEREEAARIEAENLQKAEEAKLIAAENARLEQEAKEKLEKEEAARIEAENLQKAEEAKLIAAENARLEQEAKYKLEREEAAHIEAENLQKEEEAKRTVAENARLKQEAKDKLEREEVARIEAENLQKAEEAKLIAAENVRLEQEAKVKLDREEAARIEAENLQKAEEADRIAADNALIEQEAKVKLDREESARIEVENLQKAEEAKRTTAENARLEQEAKEKLEREEAKLVAGEKTRIEKEAKEKLEREEATRIETKKLQKAEEEKHIAAEKARIKKEKDAQIAKKNLENANGVKVPLEMAFDENEPEKKKKRRRLIIFFFFLAFSLLGGLAWNWNRSEANDIIVNTADPLPADSLQSLVSTVEAEQLKLSIINESEKEETAWQSAIKENTNQAFTNFVKTFPKSDLVKKAKAEIKRIELESKANTEEEAWTIAKEANTIASFESFYDKYPKSKYNTEVRSRLQKLTDLAIKEQQDRLKQAAEESEYRYVKEVASLPALEGFLFKYPNSAYKAEIEKMITAIKKREADQAKAAADIAEKEKEKEIQEAKNLQKAKELNTSSPKPIASNEAPTPNEETLSLTVKRLEGQMVYIPSGSYKTNCTDCTKTGTDKKVNGFKMLRTEVTQELYQSIMGANPSRFKNCPSCPVENVSWDDAQAFISKLNEQSKGLYTYRLPRESEFEYAALGGLETDYSGSNQASDVAWYKQNSKNGTQVSSEKNKNSFGLYALSGNVGEWTEGKTVKGGSWNDSANGLKVRNKADWPSNTRNPFIGFRIVRN